MIKRTGSRNLNDRMEEVSNPDNSSHSVSMVSRNQKRVPNFMKNTLKGIVLQAMASNSGMGSPDMKRSAMGNAIKNKLKNTVNAIKNIKKCQICESDIPKPKNKNLEVYMCQCEHQFNFCESCLHHYVIYKVKSFEQVMCPRDGCPATLDMTTNFFKNLPADIQKNYKKIYQFYLTSKDPDLRLCPRENCEGIIKKADETVMVCNECQHEFCSKCLLAVHTGECDNEEVKFFEGNLHYRQCKKCKFVIQKNQGCNHITCKCGFEFCYVCGENWSSIHYGNHDENGRVLPVPDPGVQIQHYEDPDCCNCDCCDGECCGCECCDCQCCDNCRGIDECCGETCGAVIKLPIKLLLFCLFIPLMMMVFVGRDLFVILGMLLTTIIAGLFGFSFEIISQLQGVMCILGVLFFPVTMMAGVVMAFREVFCDVIPDLCNDYWDMFCGGSRQICDM